MSDTDDNPLARWMRQAAKVVGWAPVVVPRLWFVAGGLLFIFIVLLAAILSAGPLWMKPSASQAHTWFRTRVNSEHGVRIAQRKLESREFLLESATEALDAEEAMLRGMSIANPHSTTSTVGSAGSYRRVTSAREDVERARDDVRQAENQRAAAYRNADVSAEAWSERARRFECLTASPLVLAALACAGRALTKRSEQ